MDGLSFEVRPGEVTGFLGAVFTTWTAVLMLAAFALFARSDISTST